MTFFEIFKHFWALNREELFTQPETTLYFYLLSECAASRWKNPLEIKTRKIEVELEMTRKAIAKARASLKERGLIDYSDGKGMWPSAYLVIGINITNDKIKFPRVVSEDVSVGNNKRNNSEVVVSVGNDKRNNSTPEVFPTETTPSVTPCLNLNLKNITSINSHSVARARNGGECGKGGGKKSVGKKNGKSESSLFTEKELDRSQPKGITTAQLASFTPPTLDEVRQCFSKRNAAYRLPDWETEAEIFYNYYDSQGWVKSNGRKVANWESLVGEWIMRKQKENNQTQQRHEQPPTYRRPTPDDIAAEEQRKLAERIRRRLATPAGAPGGDGGEADLPF